MKLDNPKFIVFMYADGLKPMTDFCDTQEAAVEAFDKLLETDGFLPSQIAKVNTEMKLFGNFDIMYPKGFVASFCLAEVYPIGMDVENTTEQEDAYAIINEKEYSKFVTDFYETPSKAIMAFIYKFYNVGNTTLIANVMTDLLENFSTKHNWTYKEFKIIKIILP